MKKAFIRALSVILVLCLLFGLTGCDLQETFPFLDFSELKLKIAYKRDPSAYVVFLNTTEPTQTLIPLSEVMSYESQHPDCNGTWFRDRLEGEDLCIYNSYLYAMEHCYIGFELFVEDNSKNFFYIREALSLDSPFMAQNYDQSEITSAYEKTEHGQRIHFRAEQFTQARWEKNLQALEKCREIVAGIPASCDTQESKMEYLYRYVCDNVEYIEYEQIGQDDYLYDAVIEGETMCDGYSNMLNLLFNLAGIESYEAMGSDYEDLSGIPEEEWAEYAGHTWVVAKIGESFYNFDPTYEDTDEVENDPLYYFGYSDHLNSVKYMDLEEMRPKCTDTSRDFSYADLIVSDITTRDNAKQIAKLTEHEARIGRFTTIVAVQSLVEEEHYDIFFDLYEDYVYIIVHINIQPMEISNNTILFITVSG